MSNNESDPEPGSVDSTPSNSQPALQEPEFPLNPQLGQIYSPGNGDRYQFVSILYGHAGGRWSYWAKSTNSINQINPYLVVIDRLFSINAQFAGSLPKPYDGVDSTTWVKVKGWTAPDSQPMISVEPLEKSEVRYERNDIDRIDRLESGITHDANNKEDQGD